MQGPRTPGGGKEEKVRGGMLRAVPELFVNMCLVDGRVVYEAKALNQRIAQIISQKWEQPYLHMCGYINAWISTVLIEATHL